MSSERERIRARIGELRKLGQTDREIRAAIQAEFGGEIHAALRDEGIQPGGAVPEPDLPMPRTDRL